MSKDIFSVGEPTNKKLFQRDHKTDWVEESYITGRGEEEYISSNFDLKKLRLIFILVVIIFSAILFRIGYLQIAKGREYRLAAEENRIRIEEIKAPRGIIYDQGGGILAHNVPNFLLSYTPADLPKDENKKNELINKIAKILSVDPNNLQEIIDQYPDYSYQSFILQDHIPYEQAILLKIISADLPGVSLKVDTFREYLTDSTFSHLLGYMGKVSPAELEKQLDYSYDDYIGKAGLEVFYEDELRGKNGKKEIEVNSLGKESKIITESKAETGQNIILTIDKNLQEVLGKAIEETITGSKSITGAAVAIDPHNGEVLALISAPGFDNNAFTLGLSPEAYQEITNNPKKPLFNRAITGEYPSGSTIKPLIALAALEEGIINQNTTFLSTGGIQIDKWFFPDWKAGGHGQTDVRKAITESVNTFFYIVGGGYDKITGLGVDRIKSYLELFGLNNTLHIQLPGEASGFLPTKEWKESTKGERWYIGDTYHLAIGQGDILVTPLQIASYTATIANKGTLYKPHLVKAFSDSSNTIIKTIEPEIIRQDFITEAYYQVVKGGLRNSVLYGSSRALADLPFEVAGKTGTAQFGNQGKTHAWFTSFAPYEDPEIVITVLVEGGGEGHATALPIAKKGLQYWFSRND